MGHYSATIHKCNPIVTLKATIRNLDRLGDRLKSERARLGWTREAMAKIGEVSRASQRLYDVNERIPSLTYLYLLADAGANLSYLLVGESANADTDQHLMITESALSKAYRLTTEMLLDESGRVFTIDDAEDLFISLVKQIHHAEAPEINISALNETRHSGK